MTFNETQRFGAPVDLSGPSAVGGVWLPFEAGDPVRQFATIMFIRGGLIAIAVTLVAGMLGALYSIPTLAPSFQALGIDLRQLRPVHTTFASAWIFLGGVAVVHRWLQDYGGIATRGDRIRLRVQVVSWSIAGAGILVTLALGIGSGREYVGFHPRIQCTDFNRLALLRVEFFSRGWTEFFPKTIVHDDVGRWYALLYRHVR